MPVPKLKAGDNLSQEEFHLRYDEMSENYRAELIGGVVFEPSPVGVDHSREDHRLVAAFVHFAALTKGLESGGNATVILSAQDELQPDLFLRIIPAFGGQSRSTSPRFKDGAVFIEGAPELVAEVSQSTKEIDLHLKKQRYTAGGVLEYIVFCLRPRKLFYFDLRSCEELPCENAVFKSRVFPGLWIDRDALIEFNYVKLMDTLATGMRSEEYLEFAKSLAKLST